jgi:hypothetical protein
MSDVILLPQTLQDLLLLVSLMNVLVERLIMLCVQIPVMVEQLVVFTTSSKMAHGTLILVTAIVPHSMSHALIPPLQLPLHRRLVQPLCYRHKECLL